MAGPGVAAEHQFQTPGAQKSFPSTVSSTYHNRSLALGKAQIAQHPLLPRANLDFDVWELMKDGI